MEDTSREQAIGNAKLVLKQAGYFVDNLWHVDDIKSRYNCNDDDQAQSIINDALTNGATMEQIWYSIDMAAQDEGLTLKD
jgi:hypothetical protein